MGIKKAIKRISKIEETSITAIISSFTNNNFQVDRQTQKDQDNEIYYYSLRLLREIKRVLCLAGYAFLLVDWETVKPVKEAIQFLGLNHAYRKLWLYGFNFSGVSGIIQKHLFIIRKMDKLIPIINRDMNIYFKSNWDRDIPDIPAELVEHILFGYTFPGDKVYDPFGDFMVARMVKDKKRVLVATSQEKEN